jgi:GTP-binding protein EngB required for normal cell division
VRLLLALAVVVLFLGGLLLAVLLTESLLNIGARLEAAPAWLEYVLWAGLGLLSLAVGWVLWRLLMPARRPARQKDKTPSSRDRFSEAELTTRIEQAESLGVDTRQVHAELARLRERRAAGEIHVALFGEISTGKSALIRALLPGAQTASDVGGGTTRELRRFRWTSPAGDALVLTDMPGTGESGRLLDDLARDEAVRAHVVVYVCDGDLTRAQVAELSELMALDKPLIVALNKADRYTADELALVRARLLELVAGAARVEVVAVSAGGRREARRLLPDGTEERVEREIPPRVDELARALQRMVDGDPAALEQLRDSAVFVLVGRRLDEATALARRERADALVEGYAKKAVIGALAAVTPGADLLIQGWLGTQMVKELAALYEVKVSKVDADLLLQLVQKHVGKATTLILAVAGNALKAFPGLGTLAGGILHAVAYGMIFRTLGRALVVTLETRGELHPVQTATLFKETLGENLDTSARGLARLAVEEARRARAER